MKFLLLGILVLVLTCSVFAGGLENKVNYSAEFGRTLNRNSSIDADAAMYNPAGLIRMKSGDYWNVGFQYIGKEYFHTMGTTRLESDEPSVLGNFFGVHREGKNAFFGGIGIVGGGGKVIYPQGSARTTLIGNTMIQASGGALTAIQSQNISLESIGYGYSFGVARELDRRLSGAIAVRYIDSFRKGTANAVLTGPGVTNTIILDFKDEADNWGMVAGLDYLLTDKHRIGIRYESRVKMIYDRHVSQNTTAGLGYTDGARVRRDFPAVLGVGFAWDINPRWNATFDYTSFMNESAVMDDFPNMTGINNSYDAGFSLEYKVSEKLFWSAGYLYTSMGVDAEKVTPEAAELDANSYAFGFKYKPRPDYSWNAGLLLVEYDPATTKTGVVYDKDVWILSVGLERYFK